MDLASAWENHAPSWIEWARTPDHDAFWHGTWPALRDILPDATGCILDVGCGEGRLGRELARLGHRVVGVDRSATMASAAKTGASPIAVVQADAARLPMADASMDAAVACMSLQDMDDLPGAVSEVARVLRPHGSVSIALVHPIANCADDPSALAEEVYTVTHPYLVSRRTVTDVSRDGLTMTFETMHHPLSTYVGVLARAGLAVAELREHGDDVVPWLLVMRAVRLD